MTKEEAEQTVIEAVWAYSRALVNHVNAVKKAIETGSILPSYESVFKARGKLDESLSLLPFFDSAE